MPKLFFHLATPNGLVVDDEGIVVPDLNAAQIAVESAAKQLMAQALEEGSDVAGFCFNVVDEAGQQVLVYDFKNALDGGGGHLQ